MKFKVLVILRPAPLRSTPLLSAPLRSTPPTPLHSAPLLSTPLHSAPLHSAPLRSAPLGPLAPRDASSPVPPTVPSIASSVSDSKSVNAFVPGSAASAASALSRAPFQSIPVCSHHRRVTCAPGRWVDFSHRSRIVRVAINCATVFCLRRIDVRIQTISAS